MNAETHFPAGLLRGASRLLLAVQLTLIAPAAATAQGDPASTRDALPRHAISGTPMTIDVPPGFQPTSLFLGLFEAASTSSILVMELPSDAARSVADTDWRRDFEQRGVRVLEVRDQSTKDRFGVLIRASQPATPGQDASECWYRIFGDEASMWMVVARTPKEGSEARAPVLRDAVMSARLDGERSDDPFEGLPFRLEGLGGLEVLSRLPAGIVLTSDGEPDREGIGKAAYFAVAIGESLPDAVVNVAVAVESQARASSRLSEIAKATVTPLEVDGLKGAEAVIEGAHAKSGRPMTSTFVLLFDGATAWQLQGSVATDQAETWLPVFRKLTAGFVRQRRSFVAPNGTFRLFASGSWERLASPDEKVDMQLGNPSAACYVACYSDTSTSPAKTPLLEYAALVRDFYVGEGATLESTTEKTLGGRPALESVLRRQADSLVQIITVIDGGNAYHRLTAWAPDWTFELQPSCLRDVTDSFDPLERPGARE